jgi:hypothetical protein
MRLGTILSSVFAIAGIAVLIKIVLPPTNEEPLRILSSAQCLDCHAGVAEEWQASHHKFAYENPEVRKLSNNFANQECIACHAPRPVLSFEPGERVLARQSERGLGVDCLACHAHPEGGVGTSNPNAKLNAPCRPKVVDRMASVEHCAACHNQHKTVEQWRAAPENLKGDNCLQCHMPDTWREGGRKGRDHSFKASHDLPSLQAAATMDAAWDQNGAWVSLSNQGAGHNFPTDERSRAADLQVRWKDAQGVWGLWEHVHRFRDPYRDETDLTNTQLPAGETQRFELTPIGGTKEAEVRLLYRLNPYLEDTLASEMFRMSLRK